MKKYIFLSILAAVISFSHASAATKAKPKTTYPSGCTATTVYSATTGKPCSANTVASRQYILKGAQSGYQQLQYEASYQQASQQYNKLSNDVSLLNSGTCPYDMGNCGLTSGSNLANIFNSSLIYLASAMIPQVNRAQSARDSIWNGLVRSFESSYCDLNPGIVSDGDRAYCHSLF